MVTCTEFFVGLLGASGDIETEEWCGQFYVFRYEASSIFLYATKAMDRGSGHDHPVAEAEAI